MAMSDALFSGYDYTQSAPRYLLTLYMGHFSDFRPKKKASCAFFLEAVCRCNKKRSVQMVHCVDTHYCMQSMTILTRKYNALNGCSLKNYEGIEVMGVMKWLVPNEPKDLRKRSISMILLLGYASPGSLVGALATLQAIPPSPPIFPLASITALAEPSEYPRI